METARCKAFLEAARGGSFTAAADVLGYTPAGVGQLVTALEDELGVQLFVRTRRGVRLTKEGEHFLPLVQSLIRKERDIYECADQLRGVEVGRLVIASYPSLATYFLPELIREFKADYPKIDIEIMDGNHQDIMDWTNEGTADLAFTSYLTGMDEQCDWIPLADDPLIAVLPEDHPFAKKKSFPIEQCEHEDMIMPSKGKDINTLTVLESHGIHANVRYTTYDNPPCLAMIQMGLGIGIMNKLCTKLWDEHLVKLPLDPPQEVTYGIAYHKDGLSAAAAKFKEYAVRFLQERGITPK